MQQGPEHYTKKWGKVKTHNLQSMSKRSPPSKRNSQQLRSRLKWSLVFRKISLHFFEKRMYSFVTKRACTSKFSSVKMCASFENRRCHLILTCAVDLVRAWLQAKSKTAD
eukprot:1133436-Pelagomonas_calceolata.AAC.1